MRINEKRPIKANEKDIYNITNNSVKDIWREFPVFSLPSFKQITNNLKLST